MEEQLFKSISIEDKAITHFVAFSLKQQFNAHHYFELKFNLDHIGMPGLVNLDETRDFVGKSLSASFGYPSGELQQFVGLVTKVELSQSHGFHGIVIVSGYSPTILIDRGSDLGSYLNKTLEEIARLAVRDTPANDLKLITNPARKTAVDYMIQYKESDFDFLNRLSAEYYEWFFYDGESLNFGKPDEQKEITLTYGRDIKSLQYAMAVAPIKNKRFSYNANQDEMLQGESTGSADGRPDLVHAINASNTMYSKTFNQPSLIRVDNGTEISDYVKNEEKANVSELLKINATGDNPQVGIGTLVDISMSLKAGLDFKIESLGQFLVTSIMHTIDERGAYTHTFEGVVSTTERLIVKDFKRPNPDMQLADVTDNADPKGQGRIKVKFKWQCQTNEVTEWLRVVTPDAGSSDKVSKNRGFTFIPEKGDQVMVAFEEGNINSPVVLGSVYHGNSGTGGGASNNTKSLTSRSGNTIILNDSDGSINVKDPSGNVMTMHGDGTVTLYAPNMLNLVSKDINITAGNNINIIAKPSEQGGGEGTINITAQKSIASTAEEEGLLRTQKKILLSRV